MEMATDLRRKDISKMSSQYGSHQDVFQLTTTKGREKKKRRTFELNEVQICGLII